MPNLRPLMVMVLALALSSWACLDARQGQVTGTPDTTDTTHTPPPTCTRTQVVVTATGTIAASDAHDLSDPSFIPAPHGVFFAATGTTGANAPGDTEVVRVTIGSGVSGASGAREQLTFNDAFDTIVAATDDAVLVASGDPFGTFGEGSTLGLLREGHETRLLTGGRVLSPHEWLGPPARLIGTDLVAWRDCTFEQGDDGQCRTQRISVFHDQTTEVVDRVDASAGGFLGPEADGSTVLWARSESPVGASYTVFRWTPSAGTTQVATGVALQGRPVPSGDVAFWATRDGIERVTLATGARTLIQSGLCTTPAVDAGQAVFACAAASLAAEPPPGPFTRRLFFWDGAAAHAFAADAAGLASPRIQGHLVAWLAYARADAGCYDFSAGGQVMLATTDALDTPTAVASVGVGCMCCDAFWAAPQLEFGVGYLAWNYAAAATDSQPGPQAGPALGYALLREEPVACHP